MRFRRMMVSVLAFWMVAMLLPTSASAQFRLRIEDMATGQGVVVTDFVGISTPEGDMNGGAGFITVMLGGLGPVMMSLTTGQTSNYGVGIGTTGGVAEMKLTSLTMQSQGPVTLRLTLEDTGYPLAGPGNLQVNTQVLNLAFAAPGGGTLNTSSWANTDPNAVPLLGDEQHTIGSLGAIDDGVSKSSGYVATVNELDATSTSLSPGGELFGEASSATFAATGPFSLFTQVIMEIKGTGGGSLQFDQLTTVVQSAELPGDGSPEPGSLMLIATGVIGLGSRMRRRLFARG